MVEGYNGVKVSKHKLYNFMEFMGIKEKDCIYLSIKKDDIKYIKEQLSDLETNNDIKAIYLIGKDTKRRV